MRSSMIAAGLATALTFCAASPAAAEDVAYSYDSLGRLVGVSHADGTTITYAYDLAGNRTQQLVGGVNRTPIANPDVSTTPREQAVVINPLTNDSDPDGSTLTITGVTTPAHGTLTFTPTSITYTPAVGYTGPDAFNYTISDGSGGGATGTVSITVVAINHNPVAATDIRSVAINTADAFNPLENDSDADSDTLSVTATTAPTNGTVSRAGNVITYTPAAGFTGSDSFSYTVSDGQGGTATGTVTITVSGGNASPNAVADILFVQKGAIATLNPRTNDNDPNGDALTVTGATGATHGALLVQSGLTIRYTPTPATPAYVGPDSFTYTISDGNGGSATGAVSVIVNDPPIAGDDAVGTPMNTVLTFSPLVNDSDPEGQALRIGTKTNGTAGGVVTIVTSNTQLKYTPPSSSFVGVDTFTYTARDPQQGADTATVTVTVGGSNQAPNAVDDTALVQKNVALSLLPLSNDTDADGHTLSITAVGAASHGAIVQSSSTLTYTPASNYVGADSFTYTVSDGNGGSDTATVAVTVNSPPVAIADTRGVTTNIADSFDPTVNDTDPENDTLSLVALGAAAHGTVARSGNVVTYTPNTGYVGADSYSYTLSDGRGGSAVGMVSLTVGSNRPPVAVNDTVFVQKGVIRVFLPLANDSDPDGNTLAVTAATGAAHGTLLVQSGTSIRYTPTSATYVGSDSFTYSIGDGAGGTATATVAVTVNDPPIATNDAVTTPAGTAITFDPRSNDTDPEGLPLTITAKTDGTKGVVAIVNSSANLRYTPNVGATGSDSFNYTINDGRGGVSSATVTVTMTAANLAPDAINDVQKVQKNTAFSFDPRSNDSDPEGAPLTITAATNGVHGTVTYSGTLLTYSPVAGYTGSDTFTYTISDGVSSDTASVTVTVNAQPTAVNDTKTTATNTAITFDPRSNDTDPESQPLSIVDAFDGLRGTVTFTSTALTYVPAAGYAGPDSFSYIVSDGWGGSSTGTVNITIGAAITVLNPTYSVNRVSTTTVDRAALGSSSDASTLTITEATGATINSGGASFSYTAPNVAQCELDQRFVSYTLQHPSGSVKSGVVTFNVAGATPPIGCPND